MSTQTLISTRPFEARFLGLTPRGMAHALYGWLVFGWILGVILRLSVRDLSPFTLISALHYATPTTMLFGLAFLIAIVGACLHKRGAVAWFLLGVIVTLSAGARPVTVPPDAPESATAPQRMLLWNACHGRQGWDNVVAEIKQHDPDIITLIEGGKPTPEMRALWEAAFPEHEITLLGGEMVLLIRGHAGDVECGKLGMYGQYRLVDVLDEESPYRVLLIDIHGRPDYSRKESMKDLARIFEEHSDLPMIAGGDFNTPRESPLYQPVDERAVNAYDAVGQGYQPTWPWPLPLLTLDQVWGNSGIHFLSCRAVDSAYSDHRPVIVEFQRQK